MQTLTNEEITTNIATMAHIAQVQEVIVKFGAELQARGLCHDRSKLTHPEVEGFTKHTPTLAKLTYGSPEYKKAMDSMLPTIQHHYAENRHHPEHFGAESIRGMNLLDLVEMLCDWRAAGKRHDNGDMQASVDFNVKRFNLSPELASILQNSVELFDKF